MQKLTQMNFKISGTITKKKLMYNVLKHADTAFMPCLLQYLNSYQHEPSPRA